jgi:hypothetical protein
MFEKWLTLMLVCVMTGVSTEAFAQFALPNPYVFARAEDQQRARLLGKPCAQADEGHACYRYDGRLIREAPCTYHIEPGVIGSVATDQCYKMEAPRRYRGIWIDEFEGQQFIPEGTQAPEWPRGDPKSPDWRRKADQAISATIWLDGERAKLGHKWQQGRRRVFIEFIGRKTMYPGNYGHMGMSGHEIIVDSVISQRECPQKGACR